MSHRILYVIRHLDTGLHKIGITNNWFRRKRELEVGTKTTPVHVVRVNDARQIENFLHRRFKANRMPQSEWFNLSPEQLEFVRATALKARDDHRPQSQPAPEPFTPPPPPPAPIVRAASAEIGTPAPTPASTPANRWPPFYAIAAIASLLAGGWIAFIGIQQEAEYNAAKAALEAIELEKEAARLDAQQAAADQARLAAEQQAKEEQVRMAEAAAQKAVIDMQQNALKDYARPLKKAAAYDCRFYVHAFRAGDPDVRLKGFSAFADAGTYDNDTCSGIASSLNYTGDAGREFIRDKVLAERGQLPPPEKQYDANAVYRLDWPVAQ